MADYQMFYFSGDAKYVSATYRMFKISTKPDEKYTCSVKYKGLSHLKKNCIICIVLSIYPSPPLLFSYFAAAGEKFRQQKI